MRIVCISDTHMAEPVLPDGDVLIHAGDLTYRGSQSELDSQRLWLAAQPHKHIIVVPGNHDWGFEKRWEHHAKEFEDSGLTVLNETFVVVDGLTFWGSPVTPYFHAWAFNVRPEVMDWSHMPPTDVIITHGPPWGIMDEVVRYTQKQIGLDKHFAPMYAKAIEATEHCGCPKLLKQIEAIAPRLHVFGHIHEGYGQKTVGRTHFVNAAIMDGDYRPVNKPIVVDL